MVNNTEPHERLLAKSGTWKNELPYAATLVGHLEQTVEVAEVIADTLGEQVLDIIGARTDYSLVRKTLRLAAVLHDLGKASYLFEDMIHNWARKETPPIRHEIISDWMLVNHSGLWEAVQDYLGYDDPAHRWTLLALRSAIVGHHLKFSESRIQGAKYNKPSIIYWEHADFTPVQQLIEVVLGRNVSWSLEHKQDLNLSGKWLDQNVLDPLVAFINEETEKLSTAELALCSLIRALLIAADTMGSVLTHTRDEWLEYHLPTVERTLRNQRLNEQLEYLIRQTKDGFAKEDQDVSGFQDQVAAVTAGITLVEAGCGSGKTLAAYRWARTTGKPFLFMMYPTTATATQGYYDYGISLRGDAQLVHSRSLVDMEYLGVGDDVEDKKVGTVELEREKERISQALERLNHPLTICTADTVLGVMQNYRSSLLLLPVLLQSAVVFDEIHSYDDSLFEHMVGFLRRFRLPALLMTASLQPERRELLNQVFVDEHYVDLEKTRQHYHRNLTMIEGPVRRQQINRYKIDVVNDPPVNLINQALRDNKKVLIVLNTVDRAVAMYAKIKAELKGLKIPLFLYHSRFKYIHRLMHQDEIISAFNQGPCCVVTTQISEMSFDISADVLLSEIAPFAAIIQRLGRLNRYAEAETDLGQAYFWMPAGKNAYLPYTEAELLLCAEILLELSVAQGVSQGDLSYYQRRYACSLLKSFKEYVWDVFDSATIGQSLRDSGSITLDYMLRSDYNDVVRKFNGKPAVEMMKYILPMIRKSDQTEGSFTRWRHVRIIEDKYVSYDYETGGRWRMQ